MKKNAVISAVFWLVCCNVFSQVAFNDADKVLNKSEESFIENAVLYEMDFYNRIFPKDTFHFADVHFTIFKKYSQFIAYQSNKQNIHHSSLGYYVFATKEIVVCKEKQPKQQFLKTCAHELSHFLLMQRMNAPAWLNEGLATYFGNMKFLSKTATHDKNKYLTARIKTMIELRDIDLQDFVAWDYGKFGKMSFANDSYGYAIAYGMTLFLINKNENLTMNIIREIGKNNNTIQAFDTCYIGGFEQFEKDFLAYYSK